MLPPTPLEVDALVSRHHAMHPHFICPITMRPMDSPVVVADGHTFERAAIERWLKTRHTNPLTGAPMPPQTFKNIALRNAIREWKATNDLIESNIIDRLGGETDKENVPVADGAHAKRSYEMSRRQHDCTESLLPAPVSHRAAPLNSEALRVLPAIPTRPLSREQQVAGAPVPAPVALSLPHLAVPGAQQRPGSGAGYALRPNSRMRALRMLRDARTRLARRQARQQAPSQPAWEASRARVDPASW